MQLSIKNRQIVDSSVQPSLLYFLSYFIIHSNYNLLNKWIYYNIL